ncbi:MAG: LysE family transporter [Spirochaetia bacterium]|jgi:threonine/homoserine/homoserine lactone efflux protein
MNGLIEGLLAGWGIAIPVGAVSVLIVTTGMVSGFRRGFAAGAGAATADLVYATVASLAGTALVVFLEPVARQVRCAGGIALLLLAAFGILQGLRKARGKTRQETGARQPQGPFGAYLQLLLITMVNPLTVVYFAALILGRQRTGGTMPGDRIAFVLGAAAASLSWQTLLAGLGSIFHGRLPPRFRTIAVIGGNLIVAALGVRIIVLALR